MDALIILQVVGYKNSRKTTLINSWIKRLVSLEKEVSVIKHHGHVNGLELPKSNTDSMKFFESGAISSIAADEHTIQLHQQKKKWTLTQLVKLAEISKPDVLFIEGYKQGNYNKVVIVKEQKEWETLKHLKNIVCVIAHDDFIIEHYPVIHIENTVLLNEWLLDWMGGDSVETL